MVLNLGWGHLVSRYVTLLCKRLYPRPLQTLQSRVSKMAAKQRAEPGYGLPAQTSLSQLPTMACHHLWCLSECLVRLIGEPSQLAWLCLIKLHLCCWSLLLPLQCLLFAHFYEM